MQWILTIAISSVTWFATSSYYEARIADINLTHAQALQIQAQTNEKKFFDEFQKEKNKYEKLLEEYAQARRDVADVRSANDLMRDKLSALSRLQSNKSRETCIRDLDECREVAVGLSQLAGEAYETFEVIKRGEKIK